MKSIPLVVLLALLAIPATVLLVAPARADKTAASRDERAACQAPRDLCPQAAPRWRAITARG